MTTTPRLTLEAAQAQLFALAKPLPVEHVDIAGAIGRYLAEPLVARRTQPSADMSAMDGYAVLPGDLAGPWTLVGESAAGHPFTGEQARGQAVRISTGALMPADAAAVILQEDIAPKYGSPEEIALAGTAPSPADRHIRRRGLDFSDGNVLLAAGSRIDAVQAALAVTAGHRHVAVRGLPTVTVLDSGDELCSSDAPCPAHQIPASNGLMLAAMAASVLGTASGTIRRIGPVPDDVNLLAAAFDKADASDVIVTSGGASVGDHDLIRPALKAWGAQIAFWRVAIKPGKPLLIATRDTPHRRQVILGLPGNPAAAFVTGFLFMQPLLRVLLGSSEPLPRPIAARLACPLPAAGSRREFLRARWDGQAILAQEQQDSGVLAAIAHSNALIDRAAGAAPAAVGDMVTGYLLENGGVA